MVATRTLSDALNSSAKTASAPAIIRGTIDLSTYPGVTVGALPDDTARSANYTAIQAALDYANTNGFHVLLPPGTLEFKGGTTDTGVKCGLQFKNGIPNVFGMGEILSELKQFDADHPAATLGMANNVKTYGSNYQDFRAAHGVTGNAGSRGFQIGAHFKSKFKNLYASRASGYHPEIGWSHITSCDFFSNVLETISVQSGQVNALALLVNGTGSVWNNIYLGGGAMPPSESSETNLLVLSSYALNINGTFQGIFNQLNIEWTVAPTMMLVQNTPSIVMNSVHIEKCKPKGANASFVRLFTKETNLKINGIEFYNNNIKSAYATTSCSLFSSGGGANLSVDGLEMRQDSTSTNYGGIDRSIILHKPDESIGAYERASIRNAVFGTPVQTAGIDLDPSTTSGVFGKVASFAEYTYTKGRSRTRQAILRPGDANLTLWGMHEDPIALFDAPLTANRKLIVKDKMATSGRGSSSPPVTGSTIRMVRAAAATGASTLTMRDSGDANDVGSALSTAGTELAVEWTGSALAT